MKLVTGGTGLVGSHILLKLTKNGESVRAIYRSKKSIDKTKILFDSYGKTEHFKKIEWKHADILDYALLAEAFDGVKVVYHCAAFVSFDQNDEQDLFKINIDGTANMVNLALEFKVDKFCYLSSVAALGNSKQGEAVNEETNWVLDKNTSAYSISKFYGENEVWRGIEEGLNAVIVNPGTILGYGIGEESSKVIIAQVKKGLRYYPSGGTGFVSALDVAELSIQLMESDIQHERFIAVSENWSFKKLFDRLSAGLGVSSPTREAPYSLAKIAMRLEQIIAFFLRKKARMNSVTLLSAYTTRAYSNKKAIQTLPEFKFTPLEEAIEDICSKERATSL